MKKLILALSVVLLLASCATIPIQNPVCPQEDSWICEKSAELGVQPEQVYGWIYDAAAIAAITDVVKIQDLCEFEQEIADWYLKVFPTISYTNFINEILFRITRYDTQTIMLITNILNRNLLAYNSPQLISAADDIILRKGHVQFRQDMLCY
jgi:hypothetical protein